MDVRIFPPICFSELGDRSNNEDHVYPWIGTATSNDRLFLVCDGVGGEHKGEVASQLACTALSEYFQNFPVSSISADYCESALKYTRDRFEDFEREDPETQGMATTLTLLSFGETGVAVAHLGDSRVYHIRDGKVLLRTKDHKWVNELVETGLLTEQQALEHPKRNVITRVISSGRHDPPDFTLIDNLRAGDYFFMCTDGVLEQLYEELLQYHLRTDEAGNISLTQIMHAIKEECEGKTGDNFSAYLIKVSEVNDTVGRSGDNADKDISEVDSDLQDIKHSAGEASRFIYPVIFVIAAMLLAAGIYYYIYLTGKQNLIIKESKGLTFIAQAGDSAIAATQSRSEGTEIIVKSPTHGEPDKIRLRAGHIRDTIKSQVDRAIKVKNKEITPDTILKRQKSVSEDRSEVESLKDLEPKP